MDGDCVRTIRLERNRETAPEMAPQIGRLRMTSTQRASASASALPAMTFLVHNWVPGKCQRRLLLSRGAAQFGSWDEHRHRIDASQPSGCRPHDQERSQLLITFRLWPLHVNIFGTRIIST